jgi:hypothetical protein
MLGFGFSLPQVAARSKGVPGSPPAGYVWLTETDASGATVYLTETTGGSTYYLMEAA